MINPPRVLVVTGAGISAESGIPTFRGRDGYWRNLDPTQLATPEAFRRDPKLVWEWYQERRTKISQSEPNAAHAAVVRLAHATPEFLLVTQNVDDLHARAEWQGQKLPRESLVQIHGDIFQTRCSRGHVSRAAADDDATAMPACPKCGDLLRPGVVWFGESLDPRQVARVDDFLAAGRCDVVIAIGTTASFGYIVEWAVSAVADNGQLIEVNPDASALSPYATEVVRDKAAIALPPLVARLIE